MSRTAPARHYVFTAAGQEFLGAFTDADEAHHFAHQASLEPGTQLPVEVADLRDRTSSFIWPDRCQSVRWLALGRNTTCTVVAPPAELYSAALSTPTGRATR